MMNTWIYAILILFLLWFLYKSFAPVKGLRNLNAAQFKQEYQGHKLIDVREVHEYRRGHIPGAVNIPTGQIHKRLAEIPKDDPVFLYCQSGMRSKQAARILVRNGYRQVAHLNGGIMAWDGPVAK